MAMTSDCALNRSGGAEASSAFPQSFLSVRLSSLMMSLESIFKLTPKPNQWRTS